MGDTLYTVDMADIAIYLSEKVGNVSKKKKNPNALVLLFPQRFLTLSFGALKHGFIREIV